MNKRYIILYVLLAFCCFAKADDVIPKNVERRFNLEVFKMLGTYESCATMSNRDDAELFTNLFDSESLEIYNDLMGLSDKPRLMVSEYVQLLRQKDIQARKVAIKEVRKVRVSDGGIVWLMDISFDKMISYSYQGVLFDAETYYGVPYHIEMQFSYPKNSEDNRGCKIVALRGT